MSKCRCASHPSTSAAVKSWVVSSSRVCSSLRKTLRSQRRGLAARLLYAIYFNICFTGKTSGIIDAKLLATWVWGSGSVPPHWRTQLQGLLPVATGVCMNSVTGKNRLNLSFESNGTITYKVSGGFFGDLYSMVSNGTVRFIRYYNLRLQPTDDQLHQLIRVLGFEGVTPTDRRVRTEIEQEGAALAESVTLSRLGKAGKLSMSFAPSRLGNRKVCREYGLVANVLGQNHTRNSTVKNRKIAQFLGKGKLVCPALVKGVIYDVFAGNGTWRNTGYFASRWAEFHGLKEGQQAKLFKLWSNAAGALNLVIIGVDKHNNQYDLESMTEMVKKAPGKLWELKIRIYSPEDWQTRWTQFFQMPLPASPSSAGGPDGGNKRPIEPPGDLLEVAELVREAGGIRKTAGAITTINIDYSDLSKYLRTGGGLSEHKAAALRQHLFRSRPLAGPEIAEQFAAILREYPGNLGYALAYRRLLHWSVVPIVPGTRAGYVDFKQYQSILPSEAEIINWWTDHPEASIGLILGALSGVFAFDIDNLEAEKKLLELIGDDPQCPIQRSGGWTEEQPFHKHYLFQYPVNVHAGAKWEPLLKGLEFRGSHGLLIMTPSRHKSWTPENPTFYGWSEPGHEIWSLPLPELPQAAINLLLAHGKGESPAQLAKKAGSSNKSGKVLVGTLRYKGMKVSADTQQVINGQVKVHERNARLFEAGKELRDRGLTEAEAVNILLPGAEASGLAAREVLSTIASIYSRETRPRLAK